MAFSSSANFLVSLAVLFIFQLPAMMVLRYLRFMAVFLSYFSLYFHVEGAEPPPRVILLLLVQQTGHAGRSYLSSRQATPGSSLPSRNSREAPPPVEMWVILSA